MKTLANNNNNSNNNEEEIINETSSLCIQIDNFEIIDIQENKYPLSPGSVKKDTMQPLLSDRLTYLITILLIITTFYSIPYGSNFKSSATVWWCGWITALATGIGALPFYCVNKIETFWLGICNAIAAGMMIAATICLLYESSSTILADNITYSMIFIRVLIGVASGIGFMKLTKIILSQHEEIQIGELKGINARKALLVMAVMTLHSISEGIGVGVSFGGNDGERRGFFITVIMALHNIPEGLAISLVVVPKGLKVIHALLWCIFSSLPQPIFAVPAFVFVEKFMPILRSGLGFAGGAMGYVAFTELIPESLSDTKSVRATTICTILSCIAMLNIQFVLTGNVG